MCEQLEKQTKLNKTFQMRSMSEREIKSVGEKERVREREIARVEHEKHSASKLGSCLN